ncbi:hypothetical protein PC121_g23137 [Phytophthora cactorum]|nr:hypothetical protein PC121_g23137 [Phytophthora cactorum]
MTAYGGMEASKYPDAPASNSGQYLYQGYGGRRRGFGGGRGRDFEGRGGWSGGRGGRFGNYGYQGGGVNPSAI